MGTYGIVLNRTTIYECFFFKVNSVLENKNLDELKKHNKPMYDTWMSLSGDSPNKQGMTPEEYYLRYAPYYPEFTNIVGITYANIEFVDGKLKKNVQRIIDHDETVVLERFFDVLYGLSTDGSNSTPPTFKILTGFNIVYNDIPLLIKRFFVNRNKFKEKKEIPLILKHSLDLKPWEFGNLIDLANIWNFKGRNIYSLDLISNHLGIETKESLLSQHELSQKYWEIVESNKEVKDDLSSLKLIARQGNLSLNLVIKIINILRVY